jgi:cytochrome c
MRAVLRLLAVLTLIFGIAPWGTARAAADQGTPDEAKAMAIKAAAVMQAEGFDKATAAFAVADGPFRDRDLYVYIWNTEGKCLFNAGTPALVGKTLIDMKDVDGTPIIRNLIAIQDQGWISYNWPNPNTHKVQPKVTYIVAIGDMRLGVGAYK